VRYPPIGADRATLMALPALMQIRMIGSRLL